MDLARLEQEYDEWVAAGSQLIAEEAPPPELAAALTICDGLTSPVAVTHGECRVFLDASIVQSPVLSGLKISKSSWPAPGPPASPQSVIGLQLGEDDEPKRGAPSSPPVKLKEWQPSQFSLPPSVEA